MKLQCPFCKEEIKSEAIACPHCQRDLTFFNPISKRISKLEKQVEDTKQLLQLLGKLIEDKIVPEEENNSDLQPKRSIYSRGILLSTILSTVFYAAYLWVKPIRPFTLWISIIIPFIIGIWIGFATGERNSKHLGIIGTITGLLTAFGIAICVEIFNRLLGQGSVDWNAVFRLYFAPPIFLIMSGGYLGEWFKNLDKPHQPKYTNQIANLLSSKPNNGSGNFELISKLISAIAPILTTILGIFTAVQAIVETLNP